MPNKNFMSYGDAETVFTEFAENIKGKEPLVFKGTQAEWDALTEEERSNFELVCLTDDSETGETVDAVTDGDMRAVTSNAVYDAVNVIQSGTGERNSYYISSDNFICKWYKVGKICTVEIQFNSSKPISSDMEIIWGLPKPITPIACVGEGGTNASVSGFVIKTNGAVRTHYEVNSGQFMHSTVTYITTD